MNRREMLLGLTAALPVAIPHEPTTPATVLHHVHPACPTCHDIMMWLNRPAPPDVYAEARCGRCDVTVRARYFLEVPA